MSIRVGILGATGMVGDAMRNILEQRGFPLSDLRLFASQRSEGQTRPFAGKTLPVETLNPQNIKGLDLVLSSLPAPQTRDLVPSLVAEGTWVIDNSSAFRMDPTVPLVVDEVNSNLLSTYDGKIVANPNCSAMQMLVALNPLHRRARIKRIVLSTYQASSGKGADALSELNSQMKLAGQGEPLPAAKVHSGILLGNVLTGDWTGAESGSSEEETKIIEETKKILGDSQVGVAVTTVRVPVANAHSEAIAVEFHSAMSAAEATQILAQSPGVKLAESPEQWTPRWVDGKDPVYVGRIRQDLSVPHGLMLWVVGDNLRKGAALNAVQIAESLLRLGKLGKH